MSNQGQDLIVKAIERELRKFKHLQGMKGLTHKDTVKQALEVDKLISIGGIK